jgi:hypothetical protein
VSLEPPLDPNLTWRKIEVFSVLENGNEVCGTASIWAKYPQGNPPRESCKVYFFF